VSYRASVSLNADTEFSVSLATIDYVYLNVGVVLDTTGRFKYIQDIAAVLDGTAFALTKPLSDAVTPPDAISVSALKALADGFAMNDGSEAVDGSTYSFSKGISNVTFATDATATAALKYLQDTQPMLDAIAKSLTRPIADVFNLADDETVAALKGLSDSVTMQDTVSTLFLAIRNFDDSFSVPDLRATTFTPAVKAEQIIVADNDVIAFTKGLVHGVASTDISSLAADKSLNEAVAVDDADVLLFSPSRVESTTMTDAGVVSIQDYCDLDYFVEDYVGLSQSF
jgi:hypothetical protein